MTLDSNASYPKKRVFYHLFFFKGVTHTVNDTYRSSYTMAAEVGLLTRNIVIEGGWYDDMYKENFGARLIVGSFTTASGLKYRGKNANTMKHA